MAQRSIRISAQDGSAAPCPCGTGRSTARCCAPYHAGEHAADAETLMRSRYSAYVFGLEPYLLATWHPRTRPQSLALANEAGDKTRWLGLEVKRQETTGDDNAIVEFLARYKVAGRAYRLHEVSQFVREGGRWYYVDEVSASEPRGTSLFPTPR